MNKQDTFDFEKYKKVIDEDFSRFMRLEKGWIAHISHNIMPVQNGFEHKDRKKLRENLLYYLNKKLHNQIK